MHGNGGAEPVSVVGDFCQQGARLERIEAEQSHAAARDEVHTEGIERVEREAKGARLAANKAVTISIMNNKEILNLQGLIGNMGDAHTGDKPSGLTAIVVGLSNVVNELVQAGKSDPPPPLAGVDLTDALSDESEVSQVMSRKDAIVAKRAAEASALALEKETQAMQIRLAAAADRAKTYRKALIAAVITGLSFSAAALTFGSKIMEVFLK